jgi:hypothetical protein
MDLQLTSQKDDCFDVEVSAQPLPENHRGLLIDLIVSN